MKRSTNKKVLLCECKRHTACCIAIASACYSGGTWRWGTPPGDGVPPCPRLGYPPWRWGTPLSKVGVPSEMGYPLFKVGVPPQRWGNPPIQGWGTPPSKAGSGPPPCPRLDWVPPSQGCIRTPLLSKAGLDTPPHQGVD